MRVHYHCIYPTFIWAFVESPVQLQQQQRWRPVPPTGRDTVPSYVAMNHANRIRPLILDRVQLSSLNH